MHPSPVIRVLLGAVNGKIHWVNNLLTDPPRHATISEDERRAMFTDCWVLGSYNLQNVHLFFFGFDIRSTLTAVQTLNAFFSLITNMDLGVVELGSTIVIKL